MEKFIEVPFGAKDSELGGWEYTIPEGYTASIENGKIIVKKEENKDEKIRKEIIHLVKKSNEYGGYALHKWEADRMLAWLEKQGDINRRIQEEIEKQTKQQWKAEKQGKQNPAWSEEDELMLEGAIDKISDLGTGEMIKDWLKSLKDRVHPQPKQKWSEDDEDYRHDVNVAVDDYFDEGYAEELRDWLKSLKERYTWKPSDEQMEVLVWCEPLFVDPKLKGILESLIYELRKLREG